MPRRKSQNEEDDPKTPVKRVTRSSASQTTTPLANVDTNGNSPLKRPGRLLSAIDEDDDNTTPTKRNKRRRNDQIHNTPKRKVEDDERTGLEKPGRGDNLKQGTIDTPTGSRKQSNTSGNLLTVDGNVFSIGSDWLVRIGNVILAGGAVKGMLLEVSGFLHRQ